VIVWKYDSRLGFYVMTIVDIKRIRIRDFKRIERLDLDVSPITALVGGNTSGKSSVLQAAQLCISLLQAAFKKRTRDGSPRFAGSVSDEEVAFRPTQKILDLRRGHRATERNGFSIGFDCDYVDSKGVFLGDSFTLIIKRGRNANISLTIQGDKNLAALLAEGKESSSIFTPGLSGISTREELRTKGALNSGVMQGDANTYLRSLLFHLSESDDRETELESMGSSENIVDTSYRKWDSFCELLNEVYDDAKIIISHNPDSDRYVEIVVEHAGQKMPLDLASTGMLQVIQILAYACYFTPPLLLLDEPDAHLHADSQVKLFEALKVLVDRLNARVVLTSHSPQLIQQMNTSSETYICWMENGTQVELNSQKLPAVPMLMSLGALGIASKIFDNTTEVILLTEDSDTHLVEVLAKGNGAPENMAVLSYHGCENLKNAHHMAVLLKELRPTIQIFIHRDLDFRTDEEVEYERLVFEVWCESEKLTDVSEVFTSLNDVEHRFASVEHLVEKFADRERAELQECVNQAIAEKRDGFVTSLDKARSVIQNNLYEVPRKRKKPEWELAQLPTRGPSGGNLRPQLSTDPFPFELCHGKNLEKAVRQKLGALIGGDANAIKRQLHSTSGALGDSRWERAFIKTQL